MSTIRKRIIYSGRELTDCVRHSSLAYIILCAIQGFTGCLLRMHMYVGCRFDRVFDQSVKQDEVFENVARGVVDK